MKKFLVLLVMVALLAMTSTLAFAAQHEGTVAATVTVKNISILVDTPSVAYGTLDAGEESATSGTITATNNGNVAEDFDIRGADTTSVGAGWTLGATAAPETYVHKFSTDGWGSSDTLDAVVNKDLAGNIGAGSTATFELKLTTPTTTTDYNEQTANVVVVATEYVAP